jgi:hypothetical protein
MDLLSYVGVPAWLVKAGDLRRLELRLLDLLNIFLILT